MNEAHGSDYYRVAAAIDFLKERFTEQPSLDDVARHVNLSPFHFQRMFRHWAGVTPKQFLQYLTLEHAKTILSAGQATLFDTAYETGLSGTGRLHDLFMRIEGMTPGEYRNGGAGLDIGYSFADTPFGPLMVASTSKGICHMAFADDGEDAALLDLQQRFPNASYRLNQDIHQRNALQVFARNGPQPDGIRLHLKGTPFQIKVWQALLRIPLGEISSYAGVARAIGQASAARAVGTAIADNPVAFLIPCHRVIRGTADTGQYHWGGTRKKAMLGWESSRIYAHGAHANDA